MPSDADDPELALAKRRHGAEFKMAFERAAESLAPKERLLLRQYYVDRLDTKALARLHGLHPVSAVRWLARVRHQLGERTRRTLMAEMGIAPTEIDSVMRLVRSQLNLSVSRVSSDPP